VSDLHLDGNGVAWLLDLITGAEATTTLRTCQACGDRRALGDHRAYRGAGVVLRCPSCQAIAVCIGIQQDHLTVRWHGTLRVELLPEDIPGG